MKAQKSIYISHAWGGTSDEILAELVPRLEAEKIAFILDKRDLGYRQSIRDFMIRLGKADMVIIILSNKYLKSEYCMFELIQIYHNENLTDRIFPIVLDEVKISSSVDRLDFVKYWENQLIELQNKVKELNSLSYIEGITDDLNLYSEIRNNIARLTGILRDINTLNITLHHESDYHDLIEGIRKRINEKPTEVTVTNTNDNKEEPTSNDNEKTESTTAKRSLGIPIQARNLVIVALALFGLFMLWGILTRSKSLANIEEPQQGTIFKPDSQATHDLGSKEIKLVDSSKFQTPITAEKTINPPPSSAYKKPTITIDKSNQGVVETKPITSPAVHDMKKVEDKPAAIPAPVLKSEPEVHEALPKSELNQSMILAKGTTISVRNNLNLSSDDPNSLPRHITFLLDKPIYNGSLIAVPAGSVIVASIVKVRKSEYRRAGTMDLIFENLQAPGNQKIPLGGNEMHLEAKGAIPYEIKINTKLQVKTSAAVTIRY